MPLLGTRGAASAQGFGMFASIGASYWIGMLGGTASDIGYSVAVDSSGNVYVFGQSSNAGTVDLQLAKYNTSGVIQWQTSLGSGSSTEVGYSVAVDSSGNSYVCGYALVSGNEAFQIAKYNTAGVLQWQRTLGSPTATDIGYGIAVDSSGNVYVSGQSNNSGSNDFQVAKYNTSGVIQWQRSLGGASPSFGNFIGIAVDSSSNVYVCGQTTASGTDDFQIVKYNTSGVIQWQRKLGGSTSDICYSVATDSSGNVYVCGQSRASGSDDFQIAKYNTSGAIQWQRRLQGDFATDIARSIAVDSSSNVYVCGQSNFAGSTDFQIAKYDTSGAIQWQRTIDSSSSDTGRSVAVDSSGNVYVCGQTNASGNANFLFAKLPGDGTKTGTYTVGGYSFTYAASSLTDVASSLTDTASSLSDSASSLTDAASSLTSATSTLTSSVTQI